MAEELRELSILIVTWNGDDLLKNCLDSVRRACGDVPEIVVVDNANLESTKAIVAAHPNAKYVAAPENLGFAGGNNLGLPLCTRPYILLLNNDTIVHEEPFSQLIRYLKDHPKVAVAQGKMRLVRFGDVLDECGSYLTSWGLLYQRHYLQPIETEVKSSPVFHAKGACMMFRRDILDKLNGVLFHSHFKSYYEDADFCHRVWLTGNEVHFVDTPPIDHLQGMTTNKMGAQIATSRETPNRLFSFLTIFSTFGLRTVHRKYVILLGCLFLRYLTKLDFASAKRLASTYKTIVRESDAIRKARLDIQSSRTVSDQDLFMTILAKPPIRFYWKLLRGQSPYPFDWSTGKE